jgi:hypothetical protein
MYGLCYTTVRLYLDSFAEIGLDISQILVTASMTLTLDQAIKRGLA